LIYAQRRPLTIDEVAERLGLSVAPSNARSNKA
jgi:DNA-binding transcriptional regulator GbsR (MarR family)